MTEAKGESVENAKGFDACVQAFGKPNSQLNDDERRVWRRAVRLASYYRRHERNKKNQRKSKKFAKLDILKALGWNPVCMACGYDRYLGALDFHHVNKKEKRGRVNTVEEARKCRLLCANCHREEHRDDAYQSAGRPRQELDPRVAAYLAAVGVERPVELA